MSFRQCLSLALLALSPLTSFAQGPNLITNGDFELWGLTGSSKFSNSDPVGGGQLTGWTTESLAFVMVPGDPIADSGSQTFSLHGPPPLSPVGGNYVASDGDRNLGAPITQTVSGLFPGTEYEVSFDWAAAQQTGFTGETTHAWEVYLTDSSNVQIKNFNTGFITNPSEAFQPWRPASFTFTATQSSHLLTFFADGGPAGLPPFALLDNVSLVAVPESSTLVALFTCVGLATLRRRRLVTR